MRMTPAEKQIFELVGSGQYPPHITDVMLAECRDGGGFTFLHYAAQIGHLPPNTQIHTLATTEDFKGDTPLHKAATYGHLPPGITAAKLAQCKNDMGHSALHNAAATGNLPLDTTTEILKTTANKAGRTAWQEILEMPLKFPNKAVKLPTALFQDDHEAAIQIANAVSRTAPTLQNATAIWLGHILAT